MSNALSLTLGTILVLGMLVLSVLSIVGLYYLTKFSFNAKSQKLANVNITCVNDISKSNLNYCKLAVVLLWINVGLSVLASILSLLRWK